MDCAVGDFKTVTDSVKQQFGDVFNSSLKVIEEEFNRRIKSLILDNVTVSLGQSIQLGCIFSKPDAYGFGLIMPVTRGGKTVKIAGGCALVRTKKRLLFVYNYAEYKNEETVLWIRKTTDKWADAILNANR